MPPAHALVEPTRGLEPLTTAFSVLAARCCPLVLRSLSVLGLRPEAARVNSLSCPLFRVQKHGPNHGAQAVWPAGSRTSCAGRNLTNQVRPRRFTRCLVARNTEFVLHERLHVVPDVHLVVIACVGVHEFIQELPHCGAGEHLSLGNKTRETGVIGRRHGRTVRSIFDSTTHSLHDAGVEIGALGPEAILSGHRQRVLAVLTRNHLRKPAAFAALDRLGLQRLSMRAPLNDQRKHCYDECKHAHYKPTATNPVHDDRVYGSGRSGQPARGPLGGAHERRGFRAISQTGAELSSELGVCRIGDARRPSLLCVDLPCKWWPRWVGDTPRCELGRQSHRRSLSHPIWPPRVHGRGRSRIM